MPFHFNPFTRIISFSALWLLVIAGGIIISATAWDFDRLQKTALQKYGNNAARLVKDWESMLFATQSLTESSKLQQVNEFFNRRIRFEDDIAVWSQEDYWATPLEFMGRGTGDCEDFAISKYFSLRELGVEKEKLRLTYVRARIGSPTSSITQAHMVLTYYSSPSAEPLVLDNLINDIRPASRRTDLAPVYSFNTDGVFAGNATRPAAPVERLSRWKDLLLRMQSDGMEP